MLSQLAKEDIESLLAEGLQPTFDDMIRLNALGLRMERSGEIGDIYALPRVAYLGSLTFREPTVGHGLWIDRVSSYVDDDIASQTAVRAFALSRHEDTLPDALDRDGVKKAIDEFCESAAKPFTLRQIRAAVTYALYGTDPVAQEFAAPDPEDTVDDQGDVLRSINVGVLLETVAMSLGLSIRAASNLTRSQLEHVKNLALVKNQINLKKTTYQRREAEYYRTVHEIRDRLQTVPRRVSPAASTSHAPADAPEQPSEARQPKAAPSPRGADQP